MEHGLFAWELDSSVAIGPGVSIRMWPMCVTCGPLELEVKLFVDDSVKGFSRSISCGFEPDTGKFRRFSSTLRSLTAKTRGASNMIMFVCFRRDKRCIVHIHDP